VFTYLSNRIKFAFVFLIWAAIITVILFAFGVNLNTAASIGGVASLLLTVMTFGYINGKKRS
jgi:hypothetical protein